jgi:hypothetical protein
MRKAQCTTLYVCDSNKEKRSKMLRSILGVLPCSILKIWRLWARTENEYTMDDFSTLTIQEPWLLKRISTSKASAWLAGKELMLQGRRDSWQGTNSTEISKRPLRRKGMANTRVSKFPCTTDDFMQKLQINLAHTFTYFANLGFWQLIVLKVKYFSKLMWCICLCSMVLMMHVRMTQLPICVSDCKGNQRWGEDLCDEFLSHNQDT